MFRQIILHWSGSGYYPNSTDKEHYHFMVDKDGGVHKGNYTPSDNLNCKDGKYAAHCGGGNTGRIGIAMCCRKDFDTQPTFTQIEAFCKLAAQLCITYGLDYTDCITHAEFGQQHPTTTSYGKIDINYLPTQQGVLSGITTVGDYLRNKIKWYINNTKKKSEDKPLE